MRGAPRSPSLRKSARRAILAIALGVVAACGGKEASRGARTVVLITVDTLRQDHVSAYARPGATPPARTPRMDALAAAGLRFTDARTPVPLTLPAHVTMLSGRPPAAHGVRSNSASRVAAPEQRAWRLVAETLAATGRCCGAFVSADPLVVRYGLSSGFETYDDGGLGAQTGGGYSERKGTETVARAVEWLRTLPPSADAFLWVHLFEPHAPHAKSYALDVEQADAAVGLLLDGLGDAGRGDAAVVLAADHGEALGELGEASHGFLLGESVLRVPLLVRGPGLAPGVRTDPADLADVTPMLLHLAGVPAPPSRPEGTFGLDLLAAPAPADRARVAEGLHGWHQHRWAQLTLAVVGDRKVEDRGPGGVLLLRLNHDAPPWQDAGTPAEGSPEAVAAVDALRAYRRQEDRTPRPGGAAPEGYGAGGAVGYFLEPEENARHPDDYARIEDVRRIQEAAAWILAEPPGTERIEEALRRLARVGLGDPDNPAVPFWRGRGLRILARHKEAVVAFQQALGLGRVDAETLLLAMRSANADGAPKEALAVQMRFGAALGPDPRVVEAEAESWMLLGEPSKAAEARMRRPRPVSKPPTPPPPGCR